MKLKECIHEGNVRGFLFECPGCNMPHIIYVAGVGVPNWRWNGDLDKPTFSPSLLVSYPWGEERVEHKCHSFIVNGQIQFLGDCTHALANTTVDIPDWEEEC